MRQQAGTSSDPELRPIDAPIRPGVLVVDDEENLRRSLQVRLERMGFRAVLAADGLDALAALDRSPELRIVLCDIRMPRLDGFGFLDRVKGRGLVVIAMSAYGEGETEEEALRRGAADYVSKPFRPEELKTRLLRSAEMVRLEEENLRLRTEVQETGGIDGFIGRSAAIQDVLRSVNRAAGFSSTVLLTGESGTGKELLAHALHARSPRADGPFLAVNCAAIPESLLESELFGHERGAFTGAIRARAGLFEQAHGGTLLLDEIGDMPLQLQTRLLRVLEDGRVRRIGGNSDTAVDVRLVAATAQDLEAAVAAGRFREDLFYRLNVLRVQIPPLRARRDDIPLLVEALVARAAARLGRPVPVVSNEALDLLSGYHWPGNVRQLEHALERAVILAQGMEIAGHDLPPELRRAVEPAPPPSPAPPRAPVALGAETLWGGVEPANLSIKEHTVSVERALITLALARTAGNRTAAARLLEISYKALVYKIREYGIDL